MRQRSLRPLGVGDIFDEGFDLYKKNFSLLVLITLVVTVPLDIVLGVVRLQTLRYAAGFGHWFTDNADASGFFSVLGGLLGAFPILCLLYAIPVGALSAAAGSLYVGDPATVRSAYRAVMRRLPSLLVTSLIVGLSLSLGFALCFVCVIVPAVRFLFAADVFTLEGKTLIGSLRRSSQLVAGDAARVFGILVLLILIYGVLAVGIEVPLAYAFDLLLRNTPSGQGLLGTGVLLQSGNIRGQVIDQLSSGLAHVLILPFLVSIVTVLYFDLRVRKEAFDIELLARDLQYPPLAVASAFPPPLSPPIVPLQRQKIGGKQ